MGEERMVKTDYVFANEKQGLWEWYQRGANGGKGGGEKSVGKQGIK